MGDSSVAFSMFRDGGRDVTAPIVSLSVEKATHLASGLRAL
jgi:hypothetical protein